MAAGELNGESGFIHVDLSLIYANTLCYTVFSLYFLYNVNRCILSIVLSIVCLQSYWIVYCAKQSCFGCID